MNEYRREYLRRKASNNEQKAVVAEAEQKSRTRRHSKLIAAGAAAVGIAMLAILPMRFRAVADSTDEPAQKYLAANINPKIVTATSTVDAQSATFDKNEVTQFAETLMTGESSNLTKAFWLKADFITVDSTVADSLGVKTLTDADAHAEEEGLVVSKDNKLVQLFSPSEESLYYVGLLDYTKVEGNGRLADIEFSYCGQPMSESDGLIYDSVTGIVYVPKSARTGKVSNSGTSFDEETSATSSGTTTEIENPSSGTTTEIENPSSGTTTEIENPSAGTTTEIGGTQWQLSDAQWASSTSSVLESTSVPVNAENAPDVSNDDQPPLPEAQFMYVLSGFTARGMIAATPAEIEDAKAAEPVYTDFSDITGEDGEQPKDDAPVAIPSDARSDAIVMSDADAQSLANVTVTIAGQPVERFDIHNRTTGMDISDMTEVIDTLSQDVQLTSHPECRPVFNGLPDGWTATHEPELQTAKSYLTASMPGEPYHSGTTVTIVMRLTGPSQSNYVYYFDYTYVQWYLDGVKIPNPNTNSDEEAPAAVEGTTASLSIKVTSSDPDLTNQYPETYAQNGQGAVYGLFKSEQDATTGTTPVKTLTIMSDGNSPKVDVDAGTYYIKQLTAPKGYAVDTEIHTIETVSTSVTTCTLSIIPDDSAAATTEPKQAVIKGLRSMEVQPNSKLMTLGQWYAVDAETGGDIADMQYECTSDNTNVVSIKPVKADGACVLQLASTQAGTAHIIIHMVPTEQYVAEDVVVDVVSKVPEFIPVLETIASRNNNNDAHEVKFWRMDQTSGMRILSVLPKDCGKVAVKSSNKNIRVLVAHGSFEKARKDLHSQCQLGEDKMNMYPAHDIDPNDVYIVYAVMDKPVTGTVTINIAETAKYTAYQDTFSVRGLKVTPEILNLPDKTIPLNVGESYTLATPFSLESQQESRLANTCRIYKPEDVYSTLAVTSTGKAVEIYPLKTIASSINSDKYVPEVLYGIRIRGVKAGTATITLRTKGDTWLNAGTWNFEVTVAKSETTPSKTSCIDSNYFDKAGGTLTAAFGAFPQPVLWLKSGHGKVTVKSDNAAISVVPYEEDKDVYAVEAKKANVQGTVTVTIAETTKYKKFSQTWKINVTGKANPNLDLSLDSQLIGTKASMSEGKSKTLEATAGHGDFGSYNTTGDIQVTYTSSNPKVIAFNKSKSKSVTVSYHESDGVTMTAVGAGEATVTARTNANKYWQAGSTSVKITVQSVKKNPVIDLRGTTQTATTSLLGHCAGNVRTQSGKVTVTSSNPSVATATVSSYVWSVPNPAGHIIHVTPRQPGTAKMTVKVAGNNEFKAATKTFTIKVTQCSMDSISRELQGFGTLKGAVQKDVISNPVVLAKAKVGNGYEFQAPGTFKTYPYVGTVGKNKGLETIDMVLVNGKTATSGEYAMLDFDVHCQGSGWKNGSSYSGAPVCGKGRRLEAIKIKLTGSMRNKYDIYYRVHAQNYGWMAWAKNGAAAGSEGHSKRMEAIQIVVMKKGATAPGKNYAGIKQSYAKAFVK